MTIKSSGNGAFERTPCVVAHPLSAKIIGKNESRTTETPIDTKCPGSGVTPKSFLHLTFIECSLWINTVPLVLQRLSHLILTTIPRDRCYYYTMWEIPSTCRWVTIPSEQFKNKYSRFQVKSTQDKQTQRFTSHTTLTITPKS